MEQLKSKKGIKIPKVFFISNKDEIKDIPIGVPFIYGDDKEAIIKILEYETLYNAAIKTGLPFNFKSLLKDAGYTNLEEFEYENTIFVDFKSDKNYDLDTNLAKEHTTNRHKFKKYLNDTSAYIMMDKLKDLNVFPVWYNNLEEAVSVNIHSFSVFDHNMYNKKLGGMYGSFVMKSPKKNLIGIDISYSIPRAISSIILTLAKNLAENFYCDVFITGARTRLYLYEELYTLKIEDIYNKIELGNDQEYFKKLVRTPRSYNTAIVFGDNHHPGMDWNNEYNNDTYWISDEDGKKLCNWEVEKVISFNKDSNTDMTGYARWFSPKETEYIKDWVKYLK